MPELTKEQLALIAKMPATLRVAVPLELGPQEIIQPGDQCQSYFPTVEGKPSVEWFKVRQFFDLTPHYYCGTVLFRRPINQEEGK